MSMPAYAENRTGTVWSIRPPPTGLPLTNSVTWPPVAGLGSSATNLHPYGDLTGGQPLLSLLPVDEHAHRRARVGELAVLDEQREATHVVGLGHDHALGAFRRHDRVCADRVRVVVDARDHSRHDVLDVAAILDRRHVREG